MKPISTTSFKGHAHQKHIRDTKPQFTYIFFFYKQMHDYIAVSCDCNQLNFKVLSIIRQPSREKNNMFSHDETKLVQCPTNNHTN